MKNEGRKEADNFKCPACGASVDSESYRCSKCMIYFCYKCRRRVQKKDPQFQCQNKNCDYYGKLLCDNCFILKDDTTPFKSPNYTFGFIGLAAMAIGGVSLVWGNYLMSIFIFATIFIGGVILAFLLGSLKSNPVKHVVLGRFKACPACEQRVESLSGDNTYLHNRKHNYIFAVEESDYQ